LKDRLDRLRKHALLIGASALAASLAGSIFDPDVFFRSYLVGFLMWSGVALGALAILCLHQFVGGEWGFVARRVLEAATRTLPWLPLFFLPLVAGLSRLYPWVGGAPDRPYLNAAFFLVRAALYFAVWIFLARRLNKLSREQDRGERYWVSRLQVLGALGMLAYGLSVTFASIDWVMSLEPEWYSTIYGLTFMVGQVLSAFAFLVLVLWFLSPYEPLASRLRASHFHDLGNFILTFVLLWAYLAFSQYLLIWAGNLPEEIPWYIHRTRGGWRAVGIALVVFHFALPFVLLLSRQTKRRAETLIRVAAVILVARFLDLVWLVMPASRERLGLHWMDAMVPIGIGGLWLALFLRELPALPLLALNDPRFAETPGEEGVAHGTS
jgi:hypothetical protein